MRSLFSCCGLLLLLTAAAALAADDKPAAKDDDKPAAKDTDKDPSATERAKAETKDKTEKDKYIHLGAVAGVVLSVPGEDGVLKIKMTIRYLEANVQAQANLLKEEQQLISRQQAAQQIRNPVQRQQEFTRILQSAQNMGREKLFTVKEVKKDVEFQTGDDTKYRTASSPTAFDDKGNPKIYTKEELKELKGPENLIGYPVEKDVLHKDQTILVAAARRRLAPGEKELAEEKLVATMVVIVGDK